jgi:hypothetical protein
MQRIKAGEIEFETRDLVRQAVQPRLTVKGRRRWDDEEPAEAPETLDDLVRIDYRSEDYTPADEILGAWPKALEPETALFATLMRAMAESLDEAGDAGFFEGMERASSDVPSVARHPQNAYHSGFYSITRVIADLWSRIASRDAERARILASDWKGASYLLITRLRLFALASPDVFSDNEAAEGLASLDDRTFWASDAQVEVMRLLVTRWKDFGDEHRTILERRICEGMPREIFSPEAFVEDEWNSVNDSAVFKRLSRIITAGGALTGASRAALTAISERHPKWNPGAGDRDDFKRWMESGNGPSGTPDLLSEIPDDRVVQEALRLQQERHFEQGDLWRVFCSADPDRALRGLRANAVAEKWEAEAWRCFLWAAHDKGDDAFQMELADLLLEAPDDMLKLVLPAAVSWLQRKREPLDLAEQPGASRYYRLWDKFAGLVYVISDSPLAEDSDQDPTDSALGEPGGILAWTLHDSLVAEKPKRGEGFGPERGPRFDRAVDAPGRPGLLARAFLTRDLAYLYAINPEWAMAKLVPRLDWDHFEASPLWHARANGNVGAPALFNALKPSFLALFERHDLPRRDMEGLVGQLLLAALWHREPAGKDFDLSAAETKKALTIGPAEIRHHASWFLRQWAAEAEGEPADKAERWRAKLGPFFHDIWPLDARLRDEHTSQTFMLMALDSGAAFPRVVDAVSDFLVPHQLYSIAHSLRLEPAYEGLLRQHPRSFLKLANALIDPQRYPVPSDLGTLLLACAEADPGCINDPSYIRLFGLSRQQAA